MSLVFVKSLKSKLLVSLLVVICVCVLLVVLLPLGIQVVAKSWLNNQGLDAHIEFVGFNPKSGTFLVEKAQGVNASNQGFVLDRALLEINWRSLFNKQVDIQRFAIEGLAVDITSSKKAMTVAGIRLAGNSQQQLKKTEPDSQAGTSWSVRLNNIELSNLKMCHENPDIPQSDRLTIDQMMKACVSLDSLKWHGEIGWAAPEASKSKTAGVNVAGNLLIDNLLYVSADGKQRFVSIGKVGIENFNTKGLEQFQTDQLEINNVNLFQQGKKQDAPYVVSWRKLLISKPVFYQADRRITAAAASLSGIKANIKYNKSGITGLPVEEKSNQTGTTAKSSTAKRPVTFAVKKIIVNGDNQVSFTDSTVNPVFKEVLAGITLTLADIDSSRPGDKSPVSASIKVGEYGEVSVKGMIQPFARRVTVDLTQEIKHVDLANYNVYGKTFIGHKIYSGQLDLDQKIKITDGKMDTTTTVVLNKFKVESLKGEEAEKYKKDLGIPLSTALSLLKDSNDNIKLTIPVTGDMNNPDFSLNDVITTVTGKAIKEAIISYYTPFGLVKLLGGVVDLATGLSFEPVVFTAGKANLEQTGIDSLDKLAKLLSERPRVQLTLCGYPAKSDILSRYTPDQLGLDNSDEKSPLTLTDKQSSELLALFRSRMDNIKKYMVKQLQVNPGQVLLCSEPDNKEWVTGIEARPEISITI